MPVKFWHTSLRFWFFLNYLITTVTLEVQKVLTFKKKLSRITYLWASIICSSSVKMSMNNLSHLMHLKPSSSSSEISLSAPFFEWFPTKFESEFRSMSTSSLWLLPAVLLLVLPSSRIGSLGPSKSSSPTSIFLKVS